MSGASSLLWSPRVLGQTACPLIQQPGNLFEQLLQAANGTNESVAGRRCGNAKDLSDFTIRQLLEMAQCQDLPVQRVHGVESFLNPDLQFGPGRGLTGRSQPAQELSSERGRA